MTVGTAQIEIWDPVAIREVFNITQERKLALQSFAGGVEGVERNLVQWRGAAGDAARAELNGVRLDIAANGQQAGLVAAAVDEAVAAITEVKRRYQNVKNACAAAGLTLHPATGVITNNRPYSMISWAELENQQRALSDVLVAANAADQKLAAAIHEATHFNPIGSLGDFAPDMKVKGPQPPPPKGFPKPVRPLPLLLPAPPELVDPPSVGVGDLPNWDNGIDPLDATP